MQLRFYKQKIKKKINYKRWNEVDDDIDDSFLFLYSFASALLHDEIETEPKRKRDGETARCAIIANVLFL
jgi:hypothetical protein